MNWRYTPNKLSQAWQYGEEAYHAGKDHNPYKPITSDLAKHWQAGYDAARHADESSRSRKE